MPTMLTLEKARKERLEAECRRRMAAVARIDGGHVAGRKARDAALAEIDEVLDQLALALPEELGL